MKRDFSERFQEINYLLKNMIDIHYYIFIGYLYIIFMERY